ncbi:hypothetical protein Pcinc_011455 [Petrolisthes cinctipes]|uniref:Reverse transcriptase domain-containing protein n=1 Tax=Petrolisthes cinctipes TaxID=88211 RepID=A0AAE1KWC8_PETCI|nr:hypothetical protein Pcinc_011455 [Petrolisthes cinctipes]
MVNVRLVYFLEWGLFLSPSQSGFRKHPSTTDALVRLEASACEAFAHHQHLVCVFFDLEKAYDTTWQYGILKQLHAFSLQGRLPRFLKEFLNGRSFCVRVGTALSASIAQEDAVPQESILSVTLFAVAINAIASSLPDCSANSMYIDDIGSLVCYFLYVSGGVAHAACLRQGVALGWFSWVSIFSCQDSCYALLLLQRHLP